MNKTTFVLYSEQWGPLSCLSDEQLGRLFRHIFCWLIDGSGDVKKEEQLVETDILIPYRFMTTQISIDTEKFKRKCEKNRQNIMKRWAKKKKDTNVDLVIHNENENENENENGNDYGRRYSSSSSTVSDAANGNEEEDEEDNFSKMIKEKFMPWWNQLIKDYESNIKPLRMMTEKRIERLRQICDTYGKDILFEVCRKALASPFLNGKGKNANFIATFDWIVNDKNFLNVLEGNFYTK